MAVLLFLSFGAGRAKPANSVLVQHLLFIQENGKLGTVHPGLF